MGSFGPFFWSIVFLGHDTMGPLPACCRSGPWSILVTWFVRMKHHHQHPTTSVWTGGGGVAGWRWRWGFLWGNMWFFGRPNLVWVISLSCNTPFFLYKGKGDEWFAWLADFVSRELFGEVFVWERKLSQTWWLEGIQRKTYGMKLAPSHGSKNHRNRIIWHVDTLKKLAIFEVHIAAYRIPNLHSNCWFKIAQQKMNQLSCHVKCGGLAFLGKWS